MTKTKTYDVEIIRKRYEESLIKHQSERYAYERDWFASVLFFTGIQWIVYSDAARQWQPRKIAKWVPRPVTNKYASVAMNMIQVLSQREPTVSARAATLNPDDIGAALIADKAFPVILHEAGADEARNIASSWLTLTGTAIIHSCYDNDPIYGSSFVQNSMCPAGHGIFLPEEIEVGDPCPVCGEPCVEAIDIATGEPIGEELPKGKCKIEVFSPFECFLDMEGHPSSEMPEIIVRRRYPVDVIRRKFNNQEIEADSSSNVGGSIGLNLLRAIAYASGSSAYGAGLAAGRSIGNDDYVTVDMQWLRPCTEFPEGLVAFYANNQLLNETEAKKGIPYRDLEGKPIWPWHIIKFDEVPGRTFGRTPLDDVRPKQEQRNKLESLMQLIVTRCASPHWLIPKNLGITEITGEPGQAIEYNWSMDRNSKPERISGENIPTSLLAWLEKIDQDISDVAGIYEVLKGSAPTGVTAGTALRLLLERALTRFTPVAKRFERGWEGVCRDLLCIFQQYGVDERVYKISGPGNTWEIKKFTSADIKGSIDIVVESGSSLPKSSVGEQAMITDLVGMGVINPQNPETQYKILERFQSTNLLGTIDENIRQAQRENWDYENMEIPPDLDMMIDNHEVHLQFHRQLALKSDFKKWPEKKQQVLRNHILEHMMAAMPAPAMPMGGPGGMPAGTGPNPEKEQSLEGKESSANQLDTTQAPIPGGPM